MIQSSSLDRLLFKLFVFTLPLGRFIELPFGDFYAKVVPQFSTSVMFVGIALLLLKQVKLVDSNVRPFVKFWYFSIIYTLLASTLLIIMYCAGWVDGIDFVAWNLKMPYKAIMRDIILWACSMMALLYSYYNLSYVIRFEQLYRVFEWSIFAILFVGLLQYGALNGNGFCLLLHSGLGSVFKLVDLSNMAVLERGICFWGSEVASASGYCMFILPFSIVIFFNSKKSKKIRFGVYTIVFLYLLLTSGSSSTLITTLVVIGCTSIYLLKGKVTKWVYYFSFFLGLFIVVLYTLDINIDTQSVSSDRDSIEYILLGKLVDKENGSTAMRVSTVCNDMKIFLSYPLTGVGNGCQGYFYSNNIPLWIRFSEEVQKLLNYETGSIANGGGNFFASYISGYGLIGIVVLFQLIRHYRIHLRKSVVNYNSVAEFTFATCIIVFLLAGWYVQTIEDNKLMFMLALGCVPYNNLLNK
ncbi:hypothetical protein HMPREF1076_03964 [Parabacteroides goldsteinii CL02T12C30]|mgnify:CR=1 FL=1|uniref:O-antigen polymerase n=1 Tax=Parabacteroides goldsteinii CL02T12C30 TaxID=999418 RepID=K5ZGQ9_9BACT|nr:hypothetical protein [Parabacteroides goldsteinii]EKN10626.1 hypothetical protein HMPREF1076_03964 [Parabacteroides goldsteinii CL02T12C30]